MKMSGRPLDAPPMSALAAGRDFMQTEGDGVRQVNRENRRPVAPCL
jgi:hypothetical protein